MKILAITNMYPSAMFPAQGVFVREQIAGLRAIGLEVRVLFVDRRREGPTAYYRLRHRLRDAVAEFGPDAIQVMYGGVMADQIARCHHLRPVAVTFHGSDLLGENLSGWVRKIISRYGVYCSRRAARAADGVVLVARHLARALNGAAAAGKIRVIPCGIDLERFKPMDPSACKRRLDWDLNSFHVLFASNNGDPVKRPWLAGAAVAQMNQSGRPAALHYMSGVPNVEVPVWLNASDALLLTSLHEGSPTVVKEALACGLPVVSVDVGDVAERIEGIEGCHLTSADPAELAAKLDLVRQRGGRLDCRSRVADLSVLSAARKLERFYEEITHSNGAPRPAGLRNRLSIPVVFPVDRRADFTKIVRRSNSRQNQIVPTAGSRTALRA
ncbi:MAG: glycosyltransferase [Verrucomicrobiota bacterium]|nr:glycosyltransferase [Verrucomicrobiota bacterium]